MRKNIFRRCIMKRSKRFICAVLSVCMLFLCSCGSKEDGETTVAADETPSENVTEIQTELPSAQESQTADVTEAPATVSPATEATVTNAPDTVPVTEKQTERAAERTTETPSTLPEQTAYTKEQIVDVLKNAVNKTKSYTGSITVHHKESFSDMKISNVTPGGELSARAMNFITGLIIKPSEEDYSFSGGRATTSEGEQTQLLLPKDAAFTLDASGVKSAKLEKKDGMTHITVTLVREECNSLTDKPKHNASAIGYLDIGSAFSRMKITAVKIVYPGSVIDAYIRDDGYVSSVTYTVNMDCHGEASYGLINGSADFKGAQTEVWTVKW